MVKTTRTKTVYTTTRQSIPVVEAEDYLDTYSVTDEVKMVSGEYCFCRTEVSGVPLSQLFKPIKKSDLNDCGIEDGVIYEERITCEDI